VISDPVTHPTDTSRLSYRVNEQFDVQLDTPPNRSFRRRVFPGNNLRSTDDSKQTKETTPKNTHRKTKTTN